MTIDVAQHIDQIASQLGLSKEAVLQQSLTYFLEGKLRELRAELTELRIRYQINTPEEFERLYQEDKVDEAASWRDYQRFETLTFKIDQLQHLLAQ